MKAKFNLINTDQLKAEMTRYEWEKICDTLRKGNYPYEWYLGERIRDMINIENEKDSLTQTDINNES